MGLLILIVFIACMVIWIPFRIVVLHPFKSIKYAVLDTYHYFRYHLYDKYDGGLLNCYTAHFGGGKTLSVVHYVIALFKRYNNKKIYDIKQKKWVLQKVHIISNVTLNGVPCEPLVSLSQVVCCAWRNKEIDKKQGTRTIVLVLLDEASSQLNSRNFKSNIDSDFLGTLITSRHFLMSIFTTSQKFKLVDALLRSVTQRVIWCNKIWRIMVQHVFDADEMEYASNPMLLKPIARKGFFITDADYNAYDTFATVEQLKRSVDAGEMMSEEQILAMRGNMNPDNDAIAHPSRRLTRMRRGK